MTEKQVYLCDQCGGEEIGPKRPDGWITVEFGCSFINNDIVTCPRHHVCSLRCLRLFARRLSPSVLDSDEDTVEGDGE